MASRKRSGNIGKEIASSVKPNNEALYEAAEEAIVDLFSDTSVSAGEARTNLRSLISHIESLLETL